MQLFKGIRYKPNTNNISEHFIRVFIILNKISLYQVQTSVLCKVTVTKSWSKTSTGNDRCEPDPRPTSIESLYFP